MSELIEKSIFGRFVIWYTDCGVYLFHRIGRWFFCKIGDPVNRKMPLLWSRSFHRNKRVLAHMV